MVISKPLKHLGFMGGHTKEIVMSAFSQMQTFRDNAVANYERVLTAHRDQSMFIEDALISALGDPDQPGGYIPTGKYTPETLASMAAKKIKALEAQVSNLQCILGRGDD